MFAVASSLFGMVAERHAVQCQLQSMQLLFRETCRSEHGVALSSHCQSGV